MHEPMATAQGFRPAWERTSTLADRAQTPPLHRHTTHRQAPCCTTSLCHQDRPRSCHPIRYSSAPGVSRFHACSLSLSVRYRQIRSFVALVLFFLRSQVCTVRAAPRSVVMLTAQPIASECRPVFFLLTLR